MTKTQAIFIKYLWERCNCSMRSVAAHYYNRYNSDGHLIPFKDRKVFEFMTYGGNQLDGIILIDEASKILNHKLR